nr:hypothetical protein [Bryobacterales bacterium]
LDSKALNATPMYDIYAQIVYAFKASNVRDVMVHGQLLVRNGELIYEDTDLLRRKAGEFRQRVIQSLRKP